MKHKCYGGQNGWHECTACDGRMHNSGCTPKKNAKKDCCAARHLQLYRSGQVRGIYDDSVHMLDGYHDGKDPG